MRTFCLFMLLVLSASAQEIQVYEVRDLFGGLVNSVPNAQMQDNQLKVMVNLDIGTDGLERRKGLEFHVIDTVTDIIDGLLVYHGTGQKQLLVVRSYDAFSNLDTAIRAGTSRLAKCTETPASCTTLIIDTLFNSFRDTSNPNVPVASVILNENLVFGGYGRELYVYDGETAFPARPLGPGQPKAVGINGSGNLTGTFRYKCCFREHNTEKYSYFSAASWPTEIYSGKVMLRLWPPARTITDDTANQWVLILRQEVSVDTAFRVLDSVSAWELNGSWGDTLIYLDNLASAGDYVPYHWGFNDSGLITRNRTCSNSEYDYVSPVGPGSLCSLGRQSLVDGAFVGFPGLDSMKHVIVAYLMTFLDSSGRESLPSAPVFERRFDDAYGNAFTPTSWDGYYVDWLPVPTDQRITKKRIYRYAYAHVWPDTLDIDTLKYWYFVAELDPDMNYYRDSITWDDIGENGPLLYNVPMCNLWDTLYISAVGDCSTRIYPNFNPDDFCTGDSLLTFKPTAIENHTKRIYAIGNPDQPNRLQYSDFGRPSTFPPAWFLYVQPMEGDWFSGLLSMANDQLLIPRQNSIVLLQGASYYQYSVDRIVNNIGLQAPNTLMRLGTQTFFVHNKGMYELSGAANNQNPYSQVIDASIDSVRSALTFSVARIVDNEYWWSLPFGASDHINTKTYILSFTPKPHWKCYDFGIQDAAPFGFDTTVSRIGQPRWVLLSYPNTLYRWGYDLTLDYDVPIDSAWYRGDSLFASDPSPPAVDSIVTDTTFYSAVIKTKAFLEGPGRKKILWFEIMGSGTMDTAFLTFYDNGGEDSVGVDTLVPNFSDELLDGVGLSLIVDDFAVRIQDNSSGDYKIKGIRFEWVPWDEGKKQ